MSLKRRCFLALGAAAAILPGTTSYALSEDEARAHVQTTIEEILALLREPGSGESRAPKLQAIMERRANMPLLAKFSAGRNWRDMSSGDQTEFVSAFSKYVSVTYARRFDEYSGDPKIVVGKTIDAGRKGILVESPIELPDREPIAIEWLVSDRGGRIEIIDLIIEGISMAASQREEINAMLEKRNGDVKALIAHLLKSS
ncbi:MAG: ABC transporter substrate-binding protein [Pseudomonadota bacterium]